MAAPKDRQCSKGCGKFAVKDGLCTKHFKKEHGYVPYPKNKKIATPAAKILPKPEIEIKEKRKDDDIISKLIKERNEHHQAMLEIEAALKIIQHYTDAKIPGNLEGMIA